MLLSGGFFWDQYKNQVNFFAKSTQTDIKTSVNVCRGGNKSLCLYALIKNRKYKIQPVYKISGRYISSTTVLGQKPHCGLNSCG